MDNLSNLSKEEKLTKVIQRNAVRCKFNASSSLAGKIFPNIIFFSIFGPTINSNKWNEVFSLKDRKWVC